jgi:hypothetical protein
MTTALVAVLVCLSLVPTAGVHRRHELQRLDWRGLTSCLGPPRATRAIVVRPPFQEFALAAYRPGVRALDDAKRPVDEIDIVGDAPPGHPLYGRLAVARRQIHMPAGFGGAETVCASSIPVRRFSRVRPAALSAADLLGPTGARDSAVLLDAHGGSERDS